MEFGLGFSIFRFFAGFPASSRLFFLCVEGVHGKAHVGVPRTHTSTRPHKLWVRSAPHSLTSQRTSFLASLLYAFGYVGSIFVPALTRAFAHHIGLKSDKIFKLMQQGIKSQAGITKKIKAVYRFDIKDGDKTLKSWLVDLKNGAGEVKEVNKKYKAECVIQITDKNFIKLMRGKLNPMMAYTTGAVKVKGNIMLAMKLQKLTKLVQSQAPKSML